MLSSLNVFPRDRFPCPLNPHEVHVTNPRHKLIYNHPHDTGPFGEDQTTVNRHDTGPFREDQTTDKYHNTGLLGDDQSASQPHDTGLFGDDQTVVERHASLTTDPSSWVKGLDRLELLTQIVSTSIAVALTVSHPLPP